MGTVVPMMLESSMDTSSAVPVQNDTEKAKAAAAPFAAIRYSPIAPKDSSPSSRPFIRPTRASLPTSASFCRGLTSSSISTRMVTASDCVPTLPAMSSTSDWKQMMTVRCVTTRSNSPTTLETTSPSPSRITSHGRRLATLRRSGSSRSSPADRPPSFA